MVVTAEPPDDRMENPTMPVANPTAATPERNQLAVCQFSPADLCACALS
jgi:hypothetical protein